MLNWCEIVSELQASGLTQRQIADRVGCDQSHVSDLKRGEQQEPKYGVGAVLLEMLSETRARRSAKHRKAA